MLGGLAAAALSGWLAVCVEPPPLRSRRLVLDPRLCSVQVQTAVLDVLVNPLGCFQEGLLHVLPSEDSHKQQERGDLGQGSSEDA